MRRPFAGSRTPSYIPPFHRHHFPPVFFFGGGCFNGFFPGFCGPGFFWGSGFWRFGWDCDPFWGCPAGLYNGYYNGGSYGNVIYNDSGGEPAPSNEFNPSRYAYPQAEPNGESNSAANSPEVVLYLKDGTVYALTDYWVADGKLHYVTNYGGENSIDLDQIDIQRTVDVNAKRGIDVTLKPAPTLRNQAPLQSSNENQEWVPAHPSEPQPDPPPPQ
jgi:hypothetical protein